MPWCPKCLDEYVADITIYNECDVKLVEEKPILEKPDKINETKKYVFYNKNHYQTKFFCLRQTMKLSIAFIAIYLMNI